MALVQHCFIIYATLLRYTGCCDDHRIPAGTQPRGEATARGRDPRRRPRPRHTSTASARSPSPTSPTRWACTSRRCCATSRPGSRSSCGSPRPAGGNGRPTLRATLDALPEPSPASVAGALAASLAARPMFCDLLAQAPLNLERNVSLEAVRAFKLVTLEEVEAIGAALRRALPALTARDTIDIIAAATVPLRGALADGHPRTADRVALPERPAAGPRGRRRRTPSHPDAHRHDHGVPRLTQSACGDEKTLPSDYGEQGWNPPSGGAKEIRTPDLFDANEARYQLRHSPLNCLETIAPVRGGYRIGQLAARRRRRAASRSIAPPPSPSITPIAA